MTKEKYRKEDTGIAFVKFHRYITLQTAQNSIQSLPLQRVHQKLGYFVVYGKWRYIRRLKFNCLVESIAFECDRMQLLQAATKSPSGF